MPLTNTFGNSDIGFFDLSTNGVGALGSRLAVDATLLKVTQCVAYEMTVSLRHFVV